MQDEREAVKQRTMDTIAKVKAERAVIIAAWEKEKEEERERHDVIRAKYDAIKADADAKEAAREAKWAEQKVKLAEMNEKMAVQFAKNDNFFGLIGKAVCMTLHGESQSSIVEKARELLPPRE
jgi:hypothetical protein